MDCRLEANNKTFEPWSRFEPCYNDNLEDAQLIPLYLIGDTYLHRYWEFLHTQIWNIPLAVAQLRTLINTISRWAGFSILPQFTESYIHISSGLGGMLYLHDFVFIVLQLLRICHILCWHSKNVAGNPSYCETRNHHYLHHIASLQWIHPKSLQFKACEWTPSSLFSCSIPLIPKLDSLAFFHKH